MSSIVRSYTDKCVASEPVFVLNSDHGSSVTARPCLEATQPMDANDPISVMVNDSFRENFRVQHRQFEVDYHGITRDVTSQIIGRVQKFYENNCDLKKPRQSKVYKWLHWLNSDAEDAVVMLYRYIAPFCDEEMQANNDNDPNVANAMAVLELLRTKYEK